MNLCPIEQLRVTTRLQKAQLRRWQADQGSDTTQKRREGVADNLAGIGPSNTSEVVERSGRTERIVDRLPGRIEPGLGHIEGGRDDLVAKLEE